ncbi:MAG TPA: guanylate kinase [Clostridiales bacterium]|jgi:guanylate kinase|nr:guanylate kinase [Clostridiales bacterium]HQP69630.1 guanylate kinase [Clostridiales bacterium]
MSNRGRLVIFSAPSGSGKTTLINMLRKEHPELEFSISATTRAPRGTEKHGIEYFFLSKDEFERKIASGEFVEYKKVYGNIYGTLKEYVDDALKEGKNVLFDVDVQGGIDIKHQYPEDVIMIFIYPPSLEVLKERLIKRGTDTAEVIENRLKFAKIEMEKMKEYSYNIMNGSLDAAFNELKEVLRENKIIK